MADDLNDAAKVEAAADRLEASVRDLRSDLHRDLEAAERRHDEAIELQAKRIDRSDTAIRRTHIVGVGFLLLLAAFAVVLIEYINLSRQIIDDREVARYNSCVSWNDLVNVVRAGDLNSVETLIRVTEPADPAALTPEQLARREALEQAYREGAAAGIPQSVYRDCSPEGLRRFSEERLALTD